MIYTVAKTPTVKVGTTTLSLHDLLGSNTRTYKSSAQVDSGAFHGRVGERAVTIGILEGFLLFQFE